MKTTLRRIFFSFACLVISFVHAAPTSSPSQPSSALILGGGVGALTSALYLARAGIEPVVIEGASPGGMITQSHAVQNWPGEVEITGAELAEKLRQQAVSNGVIIRHEEVIAVDFSKRPFKVTTRSLEDPSQTHELLTDTCIIAMGTESNYLGVPGEWGEGGYWGRGVSNCAICDGALYKDKIVGIVGGGDAAVLEGLYLANIAKEVHLFVRKSAFKGMEETRLQTLLLAPNVKVHYETAVKEIQGDGGAVTRVLLKTHEETKEFPLDGLFLAIGSRPNSELFKNALKLDSQGYIQLQKDQETSIPGVYAIGDIVDPVYKQAISAAGDGAKAAMQAQKFLSQNAATMLARAKKKSGPSKQVAPKPAQPSSREVIEIASLEQFERELKSSTTPIVVDFYATWCGPCKKLSPILESFAGALSGKVKVLKVNVDQFLPLSRSYQITSMPTALLFDASGTEVERNVGTKEIGAMLKKLQEETN